MKISLISIVVPIYNEEQNLESLHKSLRDQEFTDAYEIIYIDDGSTDKSWEILQTFSKDQNVRCFKLNKKYPVGYARAFGVEKAKGEFIASIDADCIPSRNWLNMVKYLDGKTSFIGFPVIPPAELDYLAQRFEYIGDGKPDPKVYLHGSGVLMRRNVVLKVGNYPSKSVGEDTVLFRKILAAGYKFKYSEEAKIYHKHKQRRFVMFLKRFYNVGANNTGAKTFLLFDLIFPLLILISIISVYFIGATGLLALILPIGFLANYKNILFYMRNFERPKKRIVKLIIFIGIKIIISIAFILGVWKATINKLFSHLYLSKT